LLCPKPSPVFTNEEREGYGQWLLSAADEDATKLEKRNSPDSKPTSGTPTPQKKMQKKNKKQLPIADLPGDMVTNKV